MRAIETKWKGWRFRSRTEARWAVFLEKAGLHFEYEPEGVILPSGPYLPDFRITGFDLPDGRKQQPVWLEIKGTEPTEEERTRCAELALASGCVVLLAEGAPDFRQQISVFDPLSSASCPKSLPSADWCVLLSHIVGPLAFMNAGGPDVDTIVVGRGPREPEPGRSEPGGELGAEEAAIYDQMMAMYDDVVCWVLGLEDGQVPVGHAYIGLGKNLRAAYDAARSARFEFGDTDKRWGR